METTELLFCRLWLLLLVLHTGIGRIQQALAPPGFIQSTCFSRIFWMKLDKAFVEGKFFTMVIVDSSGASVPLEEKLAARCGYVLSQDVWGNPIFRASLLGCHVINEMDERFSLSVNIKVSSFPDMRAALTYRHSMHCSYFPWAPREITCEENYMEVSVKSDVPVISDDDPAEWISALPEAQKVVYQIWQLMFYFPSGKKTIVVSDAEKLGYSFNNTLARVFLRSPYSTNETEISVVDGVTMSTVSSTSMYKQRWLLLLIDTTVSCPVDGTSFTDAAITWIVPSIIPKLVLQEPAFLSHNVSMAVDGQRIENPEALGYRLQHNLTHVGLTIPVGASGGRFKSTVSNGVYGITYNINLLLEHTWTDTDWHLTKYTVIKPITTPFMPRIPTVDNNTVPETRLFDVAFGVFLPDVSLVMLTIGDTPFSPKEAVNKGYKIDEISFPNGTKGFNLEVSFDDPIVEKEYVNKNETKYTLHVNYTLYVGPEMKLYHHPVDIDCVLADVELPQGAGYCDKDNLYLVVSISSLYPHWGLYVGNKPLNEAAALSNGYRISTNATHLVLQVPLFAMGIIYEEISPQIIQARFDLALKKTKTMETLDIYSVRCFFHSSEFIVCYPNGTITVSAVMKTNPSIDMGKTRLKDSHCRPREFTKEQAFFQFHVSSCGTSIRLDSEHLIYENEISFDKETLPEQGPPAITRDPEYRLTILCYYSTKDTLAQAVVVHDSAASGGPHPFGYGTMIVRRTNVAGVRRARQVLNIVSKVSKDKSFTEFYEPPSAAVKYSWEPILFEVRLQHEAPDADLYLENCWMSGSKQFGGTPQWNILADGCANKSYGTDLTFYPVFKNDRVKYPNHFKRLGIEMRTPLLPEVYIHCTVAVGTCLRRSGSGLLCRKQCSSGQKPDFYAAIHPSRHGYGVAGPVLIDQPEPIKVLDTHKNWGWINNTNDCCAAHG